MSTTTEPVCRLDDLLPERPVAALIDGRQVAYMRNWPYAYALNKKANKVKGNFDVGPQPTFPEEPHFYVDPKKAEVPDAA